MSRGTLPRQADIRKLAATATQLEGDVELAAFPRVCDVTRDRSGQLDYRLVFGIDGDGLVTIEGQLRTEVALLCQRCLQIMPYPIQSTFSLGVVASDEQANQLPSRLEPLILADGVVDTSTILEDEVLLCLPLVAYHAQADCGRQVGFTSQDAGFDGVVERRENPFEVLAALKKR